MRPALLLLGASLCIGCAPTEPKPYVCTTVTDSVYVINGVPLPSHQVMVCKPVTQE